MGRMRLGPVLADWRFARRIGVREAAKMMGVTQSTLNRIERGYPCDSVTLAKILAWLMAEGEADGDQSGRRILALRELERKGRK